MKPVSMEGKAKPIAMEGKGRMKSSVRDNETKVPRENDSRSFKDKPKANGLSKAKVHERPVSKEEPKENTEGKTMDESAVTGATNQPAEPPRRSPNVDAAPFQPREEVPMMYPMMQQPMVYFLPADYYSSMMVPMNDPNMNYNFMYNYNYPQMNQ